MFIPLIVVNCIIIGRAEAFCSKNGVFASFIDGISQGLGYTLVLIAMCVIREFLGSGTIGAGLFGLDAAGKLVVEIGAKGIQVFPAEYGIMYMILPFGGFVTLGVLIALMQYVLAKSAEKAEAKKEQEVNE